MSRWVSSWRRGIDADAPGVRSVTRQRGVHSYTAQLLWWPTLMLRF